MPETKPNDTPTAFDGVIAPKDEAAERAGAGGARLYASSGFLKADQRHVSAAARSLDEIDAAIAEDADGVIESVFASVDDLLGDAPADEDVTVADEHVESGIAAAEEDAEAGKIGADNSFAESEDIEASGLRDEPENDPADEPEMAAMFAPTPAIEEEVPSRTADRFLWIRSFFARMKVVFQPRRLLGFAAAVLGIMSWPLGLAPDWARPYVDWIALSLVFWIPVIWVIALFVIGK